jgi:hypothetical protein
MPFVERRKFRRYWLQCQLSYVAVTASSGVKVVGSGETLNIGSSGVLFQSDRPLEIQSLIELFIQWPVALHDFIPLDLVVHGTVIRVEGNEVAVKYDKYGFIVRQNQESLEPT